MARTTQKRTALPVSSDNDEGAERESETLNQQSTQMPVNKASTSTSGVHSTSRPGSRRNGSAKPIDTQSKADGAMELEGDESDVAELQPDRKPKPSALKKPSSRVSNGAVAFSHKRKVVISGTERDVSESLLPPPKRTRSETEWDAIVQQLTSERDKYEQHFRELARLRNTEVEEHLDKYRTWTDDQARHQREHIQMLEMLNSQMARLGELAASGRTTAISLLTREGADARFQEYEASLQAAKAEIAELEETLRVTNVILEDKDQEIETLKNHYQQEIAMRQRDYDAEVANSKRLIEERNLARTELASLMNGPMSKPRGGSVTREPEKRILLGPTKEQSTICLYEDLSQLMVRSVNTTRGEHGIQTEFKCYMTKPGTHETLVFNLDVVPEPTQHDPKLEMLRYTPHGLDKLSEEFKQSLEFLTDTFKCPKDQSPQFLHQVQLHMGFNFSSDAAEETDEEAVSDDEIQYLGSNEPN